MNNVKFIHCQKYYLDSLVEEVKNELEKHDHEYDLFDIKFSGLEKNDGLANAYLTFKKRY